MLKKSEKVPANQTPLLASNPDDLEAGVTTKRVYVPPPIDPIKKSGSQSLAVQKSDVPESEDATSLNLLYKSSVR